ncbi:hypothetical protein VHEMI03680 [[Torrubiella] hemipterigena]|uniref:Nudix hydrolase domain-containing protein n=1 Tax=[Torrubiella] hemipterigena TaxID=1531966 RepID=A0A0A1SZ86_9HYPO|nr:hypothetical protein VHEMI03680 [[Torrubiella] hemipterigena]
MAQSDRPEVGKIGVGVAAIISNGKGQILVGKRKGGFGAGLWQVPGGHLEFKESVLDCAAREAEEETGLRVKPVKVVDVTNDVFDAANKHYVTFFVFCQMVDETQEPQLMEPDKCHGWSWQTWQYLIDIKNSGRESGEELFAPLTHLFEQTADLSKLPV